MPPLATYHGGGTLVVVVVRGAEVPGSNLLASPPIAYEFGVIWFNIWYIYYMVYNMAYMIWYGAFITYGVFITFGWFNIYVWHIVYGGIWHGWILGYLYG